MKIKSAILTGTTKLSRSADISRGALKRLKWFDYFYAHECNARLTCRYFGISPQTFYRWKDRYNPRNLLSLEERSHRPRNVRRPTWTVGQVNAVANIRQQYPRWGKDKLAILLKEQGCNISVSMTGRILTYLKKRGVLKEPPPSHICVRKRQRQRPYAIRKPREYIARDIGDIVQMDTLDLRPLPGIVLKHFTAHDVISKWNVMGLYTTASARNASSFLDYLEDRMPFPVKAIQVDGGPEFESVFEQECKNRGIKLFVLPPRSPKLNGGVERSHRTHTEEFYEVTDSSFDLADIRNELLQWETVYNSIRPHQALGYLTPEKFLKEREGRQVSLIT